MSDLPPTLGPRVLLLSTVAGAGCFHLGYLVPRGAYFMVGYLASLCLLARASTAKRAFAFGTLSGLLTFVPQLWFFVWIFGVFAACLYPLVALWIGLFGAMCQQVRNRWGIAAATFLTPVLWTGIEYFRSELYFLRFSWLNVGYAWPVDASAVDWMLGGLGMYGVGFAGMLAVSVSLLPRTSWALGGLLVVAALIGIASRPDETATQGPATRVAPRVFGIQLEFADESRLRQAVHATPAGDFDVLVLSEYTFRGLPPKWIREWCRAHGKFLIVGGTDPRPGGAFANTAFVVDDHGDIVFRQGKSVPIQFFADGVPAESQEVWESPWGKLGICVCYDLSFTRVCDELIRKGAEALIVPTMDVASWGEHEHWLHAKVGPVRSVEYGVPVLRACSSGVSQLIHAGRVEAHAPYPGQGETIAGELRLRRGSLPFDRSLAPWASGIAGLVLLLLILRSRSSRCSQSHQRS